MAQRFFAKLSPSFGLVAALCVSSMAFAAAPSERPVVPRFESASCAFKEDRDWAAKNGVSCGWVTVKAHRDKSDSATLRLWVVKVAANGAATGVRTPLIRIWYGPTAANITATALKTSQFIPLLRPARDVIFFDYRGMGRSEPNTTCTVARAGGATIAIRLRSILAQHKKCRRQIEARSTDLSAINAAAAAQDVRDIAKAMGYLTYDIWGASYGSFPALDLIRQRPSGLRAAIIGVAVPPDSTTLEQLSTFNQGLTAMQRECDRDAQCHARFPHMTASLGRAMERLDRERLMGRSRRLTPLDLNNAIFGMGALAAEPELVPLAIDTAEKGNAALVAKWIDAAKGDDFPQMTDPDAAAQITLVCNSFASRHPIKADVEAAGRRYPYLIRATRPTDGLDRICNVWKIPAPPRDMFKHAKSDIPVLFYSARFDMAVDNSDTVRAAKLLPHSTIVEVPSAGHSFSDDCLIHLEAAFLVNPSGVLDRSCTAEMKPIKFAVDRFEAYVATLAAH